MLKKIKLFIKNLKLWNSNREITLIAMELYRRAKVKNDPQLMYKWADDACVSVGYMIKADFSSNCFLTKLFIARYEEEIYEIQRCRRLSELKGMG